MADLARIKRNVAKMAAQNAPVEDIDGYIASEGVTVDDVRNFKGNSDVYNQTSAELSRLTQEAGKDRTSGVGRSADSFMRGAADMLTLGAADELSAGLGALTGIGGTFGDYNRNLNRQRIEQQIRDERDPVSSTAGRVAGALTGGAGLAKAGLSPTAGAIRAGYRLPAVAVASGVEGAGLGALQGFASGEGVEDRLGQAKSGGAMGLGVGAVAPFAFSGLSKAAQKIISPFTTSPERTAAVSVLEREGVPLTAGQKTGSKSLRYAESEIGGQKAAQIAEDQGRAFTDAAMRKAGGSGLADPDNLAALKDKLGKGFDYLSKRNTMKADAPFLKDFVATIQEYGVVLPSEQKKIFGSIATEIGDRIKAGGGKLSGKEYQTFRSRLTKRAKNARGSDNELADAYRGLRNALDDAMERSIRPTDKGAWKGLRRRYGNYKVLNRAALGGGEAAGVGIISPARLRMAASSGNQEGYVTGASDFSKLARAGQAVMTPLSDSGTTARMAVRNLGAMAPSVIGAGAGGAYGAQDGGGLMGAVTGALAGFIAPRAVGRLMMTKAGQRYLANQLLRSGPLTPEKRALVNAVLTYSGSAAAGRLAP